MVYFLGEFIASDPAGVRYVLFAWTDDGGDVTVETADGKPVTPVETGRFHLARRGRDVTLTSDDPNAL